MSGYISRDLLWFRTRFGGLALSRQPKLFSERNGFVRCIPLLCGWRLILLENT